MLTRRFWYLNRDETVQVSDAFLHLDPRPLVVLGEAGMGKSTVLAALAARPGYSLCTARKLINAPDPSSLVGDGHTLVIDALDEAAANRPGDAVDRVLQQLGQVGYPRFILSCRVADWRSATSLQGIAAFYEQKAVELHLAPLAREDALAFLQRTLPEDRAEETLAHLEGRGLAGLWANPQTLILVEAVASRGKLPDSRGELFAQATRLMLREHREEKAATPLAEMPEDEVLTSAGAAFASLILSGKEAISRRVQPDDDAVALRDIARLPGAARIGDILGSRLFVARGPDRFTYAHRAIGEFLGARWLAATADTPRKRRRLLTLFQHQGLTPSSLRGVHAWLAWHGPGLAGAVISVDPMGVVEYGDADRLSPDEARQLLAALHTLSRDNPGFRAWSEYRVAGLVQKALLPEVISVLTGPGVEFGLKMMVLQALKGSELVPDLVPILVRMVRDRSQAFAVRSEASERLAALDAEIDWCAMIDELVVEGTQDSVRLASEVMEEVGFDRFSDAHILGVALALLPQGERTVGIYYGLQRNLPDDRIESLLDGLSAAALALPERQPPPGFSSVSDLANSLIARRLELGPVAPGRVWAWLRPFSTGSSHRRSGRAKVAETMARETDLRRAIQKIVVLDEPGDHNVWRRAWRLNSRGVALGLSEADVVALLDAMDVSDPRWREVVDLASHSPPAGLPVRLAAARFAAGDAEAKEWLADRATPPIPDWKIEQDERERERRQKQEAEWARHREAFSAVIGEMRTGDFGSVLPPAQAYLNLFNDLDDEAEDGPARIRRWLGPEIAEAALAGFEAFLKTEPPHPTATEMAEGFAEDYRWNAGYILSAALAERFRTGRTFEDLSDERLMAGLFELRHTRIEEEAGVRGLEKAIANAVRQRGLWEEAQRMWFEPQFAHNRSHVDGLHALMRDADDRTLATTLAIEWLDRYPDMLHVAEIELVDHLLTTPEGQAALTERLPERRARPRPSDDRRPLWDALGLILRFDETRLALEAAGPIEPELFWTLRARQGGSHGYRAALPLTAAQLAWVVRTFRGVFPMRWRPEGVTSGDANPWDASDYLQALINRLGGEVSPEARNLLQALRAEVSDGYDAALKVASAEQWRKQVEASWAPPDFATVAATVADSAPTTAAQLQAVLLEELKIIQAKVRGSDVDWYRDFYDQGEPKIEDDCRDTILKMFGSLPFDIHAAPEGHVGDDKRIDIICTFGPLMVPIEIKGQWHGKLWSAADDQLDRLYVNDWRAERGVYLVLWFGSGTAKPLTRPTGDRAAPETPEALRNALIAQSPAARDGRTQVVVLDLTRP